MKAPAERRIYVYAICKNESRFVDRWMDSMAEADGIYVLDTGSDDDSVEKLRARGAHVVVEPVVPWRFDAARNRSLSLVPQDADLCVCTDLDEVFHPGWYASLAQACAPGVQQLRYRYTWNFLEDGSEGTAFWTDKAHRRRGFVWVYPVHEVLRYTGAEPYCAADVPGVQLDHHAEAQKPRSQYLPLLELAVAETPCDARMMHYLGREYLLRGMWKESEAVLLCHLSLPTAAWADERCASMRYLSRALRLQGRRGEAERWLFRAIAEAPHLREPWLEASQYEAEEQRWAAALFFAERAMELEERSRSYVNDAESWGTKPYDLAAVSAYYLGDRNKAEAYGRMALAAAPDDARLKSNLQHYTNERSQ